MADETYRPTRRKITDEEINVPDPQAAMAQGESLRRAAAQEVNEPFNPAAQEGGLKISGNVPPELVAAMRKQSQPQGQPHTGRQRPTAPPPMNGSADLQAMINKLSDRLYEAIELPSKGRFYDGEDGPTDGILHIRAMTGEEEQILATPRFVRKGVAINMIFQRCLQEGFRAEDLLTIDRTYLLIWLRGISYTPDYDVEVKCPTCEKKFSTVIDLNSLYVDTCPNDFGPDLTDVLPKSGYRFTYRLSRGRDEQEIQDYRDRRIKHHGDAAADDTLTYRTAMLLESIENISAKSDLKTLVSNLPIQDVAYIRNCINEPPFGVDTTIPINCPSCTHEFEVDLPLEANFFFPRRKKKDKTQA